MHLHSNAELRSISTRRLQKMLLKGFESDNPDIQRYIDSTLVDPSCDVAYDYPVLLETHHPRVRDNVLRKFGLEPIHSSEILKPLTPVPTYQTQRNGHWVDDGTSAAIARLVEFTTTRLLRTERLFQIYAIDGLEIDLGVSRMPRYIRSTDSPSSEDAAYTMVVKNCRTLELTDKSNYLRLQDVCRGIIARSATLTGKDFEPPAITNGEHNDVKAAVTKYTAFYLNGKPVYSFSKIATLLMSPDYTYHAFANYAHIYEFTVPAPVLLRFVLSRVYVSPCREMD
jgi:hypothetical protein